MQIGEMIGEGMSTKSAWFDRPADNAVFTYEIISDPGAVGLTVDVADKNYEDTGNGTALSVTFTQIGSTGFWTAEVRGLKEQVRFLVSVTAAGGSEQVLYRILAPTAFNTAKT